MRSENLLSLSFKAFLRIIYKLSRYLEPIRSVKNQCPAFLEYLQDNSDFFRQTMNNFSIMKMQIGFFTLFNFFNLSTRFSYEKYLQTIWKLVFQ